MTNITITTIFKETVTGSWNGKEYKSKYNGCTRIYIDGKEYHIDKEANAAAFAAAEAQDKVNQAAKEVAEAAKAEREQLAQLVRVFIGFHAIDIRRAPGNDAEMAFVYDQESDWLEYIDAALGSISRKDAMNDAVVYFMAIDKYEAVKAILDTEVRLTVPYSIYKNCKGYKQTDYDAATKTITCTFKVADLLEACARHNTIEYVQEYADALVSALTTTVTDDTVVVENKEDTEMTNTTNNVTVDTVVVEKANEVINKAEAALASGDQAVIRENKTKVRHMLNKLGKIAAAYLKDTYGIYASMLDWSINKSVKAHSLKDAYLQTLLKTDDELVDVHLALHHAMSDVF